MVLKLVLLVVSTIILSIINTILFHKGGRYFKGNFWNTNKQGKMIPLTKYPFDGYHLLQSLMVICFCMAIFGFNWKLIVAGIVSILVFNLFWNKILN